MPWVNKPGSCTICGKAIILTSSNKKYCKECGAIAQEEAKIRQIEKARAKRQAKRAGYDPDRYKGRDHRCKVLATCKYGGQKSCNFLEDTGKLRINAGFSPIEDGKCGAYTEVEKKRRRKTQMKLPQSPALPSGKLGEV